MAVVNRNSGLIANIVGQPQVFNSAGTGSPGQRMSTIGRITPAADDTVASIHRGVRVPSNARVESVLLSCAIAGVAGAVDVGVYKTAADGGAVVSVAFFASAQSLSAAALSRTECAFESTTYTYTKRCQPLWQALGLAADPGGEFDIAATITTTYNGGPTEMLMEVHYSI